MVANRVRHTVAFTLVHKEGSAEERDFLQTAEQLANIPGVEASSCWLRSARRMPTGSES